MVNGSKILLVEDEAIVGIEIKNTLQKLGYTRTDLVPSAEGVFENVNRGEPDLILMDVNLDGEKDGIEATNELHQDHDIPVVFITAYSSDSIVERIQETDALGYIVKPIDEDDIQSITDRVLEDDPGSELDRGDFFFSKLREALDVMSPRLTEPVV